MEWMADFINYALQSFGFDQVEFTWMQDSAMDPLVQAQIDDLDVRNGVRLRSEIRASRGLEDDDAPRFHHDHHRGGAGERNRQGSRRPAAGRGNAAGKGSDGRQRAKVAP